MKVLHYIPSLDRTAGGTTAYMQLLAKELGRLVELHVATQASDNPVEVEHCRVHHIADLKHPLRMRREWLALLQEIKPDVVHVNCCWMPACAMTQRWAQDAGYKVVLTPHGMLEPWIMARHYLTRKLPALALYQKAAVRNADLIHATAESERQNLLKLGYNDKIKIVANGIDVDSIILKDNWRRKKSILFLSRIHIKKGIDFLLEAVAQLKEELSGYTIHIAGEGDEAYIGALKKRAAELGVAPMTDFCGGVYGEQKWIMFQEADLFVLPTYSENFGIAVAEALASGTPVITTKGTPWQELDSHRCGWWTEVGTKPTKEALLKFLSLTESELETMGRNGRRLVEEKYSTRKVAENMVKMYEGLK